MKKTITLVVIGICFHLSVNAQVFTPTHKINCYFTSPVDTTVAAHGIKAIALLNSTAGDTMIAYINRAKYTLDFCYFDYTEDSAWFEEGYVPPIHKAINAAYARGVKIRWICNNIDSSLGFCNAFTPNYGLDSLNPGIPTINRPPSSSAVMHDKFIVIDGKSSNPDDPIVWGGSMNIEPGQLAYDLNNIMIIQDSAIAHAYTAEFNQIWGDTVEGGPTNVSNQKWGSAKKDITEHNFLVGANKTHVEVYFSPEDSTNEHIISAMRQAKSEVDVCMYAFSYELDADTMMALHKRGIYVSSIIDGGYSGDQPYITLKPVLDSLCQIYNEGTKTNPTCGNTVPILLCHNKYMIVDPCVNSAVTGADPMVETGSHNWSSAANTVNDENVMIVHDSTIANLYYQAYAAAFVNAQKSTGVANPIHLQPACSTYAGVNEVAENSGSINVYPNPASNQLTVSLSNISGKENTYAIYNLMGQMVLSGTLRAGATDKLDISSLPAGIYMLAVQSGSTRYSKKFSCTKN